MHPLPFVLHPAYAVDELATSADHAIVVARPGDGGSTLIDMIAAARPDAVRTTLAGLGRVSTRVRRPSTRDGGGRLLLVDGWGGAASGRTYRAAVRAALRAAKGPDRLVIAIPPDPDGQAPWRLRGLRARRHELLPLTDAEIAEYAHRHLAAAGVPRPVDAGRRFAVALRIAGWTGPERTRLVVAMLCHVYADDADRRLPSSLAEAYAAVAGSPRPFEHASLARYAEAQAILADPRRSAAEYRRIFRAPRIFGRPFRPGRRDALTLRLLAAAWADRPDMLGPLFRTATFGRHHRFIVDLVADGVPLDSRIVTAAMGGASKYAASRVNTRSSTRDAAAAIASMTRIARDPAAAADVAALAAEPARDAYGAWRSVLAARTVARPALVDGARVAPLYGRAMAELLAATGTPTAGDPLVTQALDSSIGVHDRWVAVGLLDRIGDPRAGTLRADMAFSYSADELREPPVPGRERAELGVRADLVVARAAYASGNATQRSATARNLALLGDRRGADRLLAVVADPAGSYFSYRDAARTLLELGDTRGTELLAKRAADPAVHESRRREAARALIGLRDPRGVGLLTEIRGRQATGRWYERLGTALFAAGSFVLPVLLGFLTGAVAADGWAGRARVGWAGLLLAAYVLLIMMGLSTVLMAVSLEYAVTRYNGSTVRPPVLVLGVGVPLAVAAGLALGTHLPTAADDAVLGYWSLLTWGWL